MSGRVSLGPILLIDSCDENTWCFRVQFLIEKLPEGRPPALDLTFNDEAGGLCDDIAIEAPAEPAYRFSASEFSVWAWRVSVPRSAAGDRVIHYRIQSDHLRGLDEGPHGPVAIPSQGSLPRFLFFSCNGLSEPKYRERVSDPELLWKEVDKRHRNGIETPDLDDDRGIHLMFGGGDQIYCDALWNRPPLDRYLHYSASELDDREVPESIYQGILKSYIAWYRKFWDARKNRFGSVLSRIPAMFTWDDHDIFDGWGSRPELNQVSEVHKKTFRAARECFTAFQTGGAANRLRSSDAHFLQTLEISGAHEDLTVIALDLRSDRTRTQVLSTQQWSDLESVLARVAGNRRADRTRHIVIISSIPLVHLRFLGESIPIPFDLDDDRRDQWEHGKRRGERARLISRILETAVEADARFTVLSGDVHIGVLGRIRSAEAIQDGGTSHYGIVHQVTSSGIVHPAPGTLERIGILAMSTTKPDWLSDGSMTEVLPIPSQEAQIWDRNCLICGFQSRKTGSSLKTNLWLRWLRECDPRSDHPYVEPISEQVVVSAFAQLP